jgi:hypothetical protein
MCIELMLGTTPLMILARHRQEERDGRPVYDPPIRRRPVGEIAPRDVVRLCAGCQQPMLRVKTRHLYCSQRCGREHRAKKAART